MKRIAVLISVAVTVFATGQVRAAESAATPEDCIRNFYRWYVTNLVANRDPMKQRKEIRQYATERLLKEIADHALVEIGPRMEANILMALLAPKKGGAVASRPVAAG